MKNRRTPIEPLFKKIVSAGYILFVMWTVTGCTLAVANTSDHRRLERANYQKAIQVGYLANQELNEVSGLASSHLRADTLWAVNDSGSGPFIYATDTLGNHFGKIRIVDAQNQDWEDLASFRFGEVAYLLVADVGDNREMRSDYVIYLIEEPAVAQKPDPADRSVGWRYRIRFVYEDGSHDCEAVAVDVQGQQILLLSKRSVPPSVYRLPLFPQNRDTLQVAKRIAEVPKIPQPSLQDILEDPRFGHYRSRPTAMDISPDGTTTVVLTYKNGYLFKRSAGEAWAQVFRKIPQIIALPRLRQAEALCIAADGKTLFLTSEKIPAPLLRLDVIP